MCGGGTGRVIQCVGCQFGDDYDFSSSHVSLAICILIGGGRIRYWRRLKIIS